MRVVSQMNLLALLVCAVALPAAAGPAAEIKEVHVAPKGDQETIDVRLTSSVVPAVIVARNPDRLVLQFANTATPNRQQMALVDQNGVKAVRIGLNKADPPVTRVVVDLKSARPYSVAMTGNTVRLTVMPASPGQDGIEADTDDGTVTMASNGPGTLLGLDAPAMMTAVRKSIRTKFTVKYVADGVAYLNAGRGAGLAPGMKLLVRRIVNTPGGNRQSEVVAQLSIVSVAQSSAVAEIHDATQTLRNGDLAYLSQDDVERAVAEKTLSRSSSFVRGNTLMSRTRDARPGEFSADNGRIRTRIGLDYSTIHSGGSTPGSTSERGLSIQTDMTRIAGTHWNLQGYWRGRLTNTSQPDEKTMQDYLDRTYVMQLYYDNPDSSWVAGFGRLYLPWATGLDTIDGGYVGRKVAKGVTAGVFLGSTPDVTSWHYSPNQQIAGSFVNFEGGNYDSFQYSSTTGVGLNMLKWMIDRPFLFFENELSYKRSISVYHTMIADAPQGISTDHVRPGNGISRSYLTIHYQPYRRISFDLYHNYLRDIPSTPTQLISTGLVDKLLYQGVSAGVRVEPIRHIQLYSTLGHADKSGDKRTTLNQMYGVTWTEIGHTGFRADLHYSKFASPYAQGDYKILTLSRNLGDRIQWSTQFGAQNLISSWTANTGNSLFFDTSFDTNLTRHTFFQSGYTISRGTQLNYDQWYMSLGYRFDSIRSPK
jgi:AMIN domain